MFLATHQVSRSQYAVWARVRVDVPAGPSLGPHHPLHMIPLQHLRPRGCSPSPKLRTHMILPPAVMLGLAMNARSTTSSSALHVPCGRSFFVHCVNPHLIQCACLRVGNAVLRCGRHLGCTTGLRFELRAQLPTSYCAVQGPQQQGI
jgi:hypothetical protein